MWPTTGLLNFSHYFIGTFRVQGTASNGSYEMEFYMVKAEVSGPPLDCVTSFS